jgi:hypothetical protein
LADKHIGASRRVHIIYTSNLIGSVSPIQQSLWPGINERNAVTPVHHAVARFGGVILAPFQLIPHLIGEVVPVPVFLKPDDAGFSPRAQRVAGYLVFVAVSYPPDLVAPMLPRLQPKPLPPAAYWPRPGTKQRLVYGGGGSGCDVVIVLLPKKN